MVSTPEKAEEQMENTIDLARASMTLEHKRIESSADILHYGNNALAILETTVATIKHVYNDPGSQMPDRVARMETAIDHLTDIIRDSAKLADEISAVAILKREREIADELDAILEHVFEAGWEEVEQELDTYIEKLRGEK